MSGQRGEAGGHLLNVEGLSVDFRSDAGLASVLDGVDLAIGQGEIVGLVGESGSGKTSWPAPSSAFCRLTPRGSKVVISASMAAICSPPRSALIRRWCAAGP